MSSRLGNSYPTRIYNEKQRPTSNPGWKAGPPLAHYNDRSLWSFKAQAVRSLQRAKQFVLRRDPYSQYRTLRSPKIRPLSGNSLPALQALSGNIRFIVLCAIWYTTSALSSNTGKAIMMQFRYPVTLTIVQFAFVAGYSLLFMSPLVRFSRFRMPTEAIVRTTLPMGMFQVGGHILSSLAISRIPVSTTHTIKALSPLFTVAAYALLFGVSYSAKTYVSLVPLTVGVMLACSFDMSASNALGLLCAFGSALVFVSSNIFFKKVMPSGSSQSSSHKLDKLNLLFYASSTAFLLMVPIWMYYDLPLLLAMKNQPEHVVHPNHGHGTPHSVTYYFFMNGTVHFAQNLIAFIILSSTSPVTYSIASLIKRVAVICIAIVWFNQTVHAIQAIGIALTFMGLYMYNNAKSDVENGEKKMRRVEAARDLVLPTSKTELENMGIDHIQEFTLASARLAETSGFGYTNAQAVHGRHGRPPSSTRAHFPSRPGMTQRTSYTGNVPQTTHAVPPPLAIEVAPQHQYLKSMDGMRDIPLRSPMDSYPSPPPSLDSPPLQTVPLGYAENTGYAQMRDVQERLGPALQQIQVR